MSRAKPDERGTSELSRTEELAEAATDKISKRAVADRSQSQLSIFQMGSTT